MDYTVTPYLQGGLANQIFQIAACMYVSQKTGRKVVLDLVNYQQHNPHENHSEYSLLLNCFIHQIIKHPYIVYESPNLDFYILKQHKHILLKGYFQNPIFLPPLNLLHKKYEQKPQYFIHVRLGDYVNNKFHYVDLFKNYYGEAMTRMGHRNAIVFSNCIETCKKISLFEGLQFSETKNALETLQEMAACTGGICANSSFSYLASWFQGDHRGKIYMPSQWFRNPNTKYTLPDWANIVSV
jgi:hypothetical protein